MAPHARHEGETSAGHDERGSTRRRAGKVTHQWCGEAEGRKLSARFATLIEKLACAKEPNGHDDGADERDDRICRRRLPVQPTHDERRGDPRDREGAADTREQEVRRHDAETTGGRPWKRALDARTQAVFFVSSRVIQFLSKENVRRSNGLVLFVPDLRFPQLHFVAVRIGDPRELAVLV